MPIITLTSDIGLRDYYVAAVKGYIYKELEDARIVDITHQISPFSLLEAAFVIKNVYDDFPKGSIHVISINPELKISGDGSNDTMHLVVKYDGHYFIGADNGIFALIFEREPEEIFELEIAQDSDDTTFPTKYVFAKAACHIARGGTLPVIGRQRGHIRQALAYQPTETSDSINGQCIYIDSYGNVITNIRKEQFLRVSRDRPFEVVFGGIRNEMRDKLVFDKVHANYGDVEVGEAVVMFTSSGYLEIAIHAGVTGNGGGASDLLGIKLNAPLTIEFERVPESLSDF